MGVTEWVVLGAAIAVVLLIYLFTRRNDGPNPWRDMGEADDELPSEPSSGEPGEEPVDQPDIIVDPSVADEWSDFTPERSSKSNRS